MNELQVLAIAKHALTIGVEISMPLLLASLLIGTLIGVVMAATQIQEFTLTFVPKLLTMGIIILLAGPWMLRCLTGFARLIFQDIPNVAP